MHRIGRLALISSLALGLSGCGSNKPIHYYTVQLPAAPTLKTSAHPVSLLVANISGARYLSGHPDCVSRRHQRDWHVPVQSLGRTASRIAQEQTDPRC